MSSFFVASSPQHVENKRLVGINGGYEGAYGSCDFQLFKKLDPLKRLILLSSTLNLKNR